MPKVKRARVTPVRYTPTTTPKTAGHILSWSNDVCDVTSLGLSPVSKVHLNNYAFLVNQWLLTRRGGRVKIKATRFKRYPAGRFQAAVRAAYPALFPRNQRGTLARVVGHVPDTALSGEAYPCAPDDDPADENGPVPGWMVMTSKANSYVAKIAGCTGRWISEIRVDGTAPTALL